MLNFRIKFGMILGISAGALIFASASLVSTNDANAQSNSRVCKSLTAQLASLSRGGGGNPRKYRQYQNAVRKQQNQLNKATRAAKRNRCTGAKKNRNSRCRQITSTINQMYGNLASLKRSQAKYAPSAARNGQKRDQIQRNMRRNGCYKSPEPRVASNQVPPKKSKRRTLLEQVFGVRTYSNRGNRQFIEIDPNEEFSSRYGTYRTLCVRKTDGYYFPVSFSTVPDRFDFDEQTCLNMCPNHDVALYIHRMPQEDSEDMVSYRTELPYSSEPFAFAYRKQHNSEIQCRFSVAGVTQSVDGTLTGEPIEEKRTIRIGIPKFRIDPAGMPDAYDNEIAGMNWEEAQRYIDQSNQPEIGLANNELNSGKKIRIVGPAFFPVQ